MFTQGRRGCWTDVADMSGFARGRSQGGSALQSAVRSGAEGRAELAARLRARALRVVRWINGIGHRIRHPIVATAEQLTVTLGRWLKMRARSDYPVLVFRGHVELVLDDSRPKLFEQSAIAPLVARVAGVQSRYVVVGRHDTQDFGGLGARFERRAFRLGPSV